MSDYKHKNPRPPMRKDDRFELKRSFEPENPWGVFKSTKTGLEFTLPFSSVEKVEDKDEEN